MHPDRKIGIAMGILLVGVVGALFFRNEPLEVDESLSARREHELNQQLRDRDVSLYLEEDGTDYASQTNPAHERLEQILSNKTKQQGTAPIPVKRQTPENGAQSRIARAQSDTPEFAPPVAADPIKDRPNGTAEQRSPSQIHPVVGEAADHKPSVPAVGEFDEYTVQFGDTLSGIAARHLGSSARYKEIYNANRDRMKSPDELRVGKAIRIPRRRL